MLVSIRRSGRIVLSTIIPSIVAVGLAMGDQAPPSNLPEPDPSRDQHTNPAASSGPHQPATHPEAQPAATEKPRKTLAKLNELRAETFKRIEALDAILAKGGNASKTGEAAATADLKTIEEAKAIKPLLQARLDWMSEYEKAEKEYRQAVGAKPDDAKTKAKAELGKLNALLEQAAKTPDTLLPKVFRKPASEIGDAERAEMKDAIESNQSELTDWTAKSDAIKRNAAKGTAVRSAMGAERNKIFQRVTALKAKAGGPAPSTVKGAKVTDAAAQRIEQEQRLNLEWETQVESLRLMVQEAKIALEEKLTSLSELETQVFEAHVRVARKTLDLMQFRFQVVTDKQQSDLKRAAKSEEKRAAKSEDLLDRYRARRNAELLELEAQVVKFEQTLAANPSPSPKDQQDLADRAKEEFERIKQLLQDGEVSRLDGMRLNNEFRRIGPERERIIRNELATVETRVQYYGDSLTEADLELIEDAHQDQFEHDALLERLPAARRGDAAPVFDEIEHKHRVILTRRRDVLKKLTDRAADTYKQVKARLAVIDELEGFIRTSIFWVRDQEPISPGTFGQAGRELARLGTALFRLTGEMIDRQSWGRVSAEFAFATAGLFVLPIGIPRIRRRLLHRIADDLPLVEPVDLSVVTEPKGEGDVDLPQTPSSQ